MCAQVINFPKHPLVYRSAKESNYPINDISDEVLTNIETSIKLALKEYGWFDSNHLKTIHELLNLCFLPDEIAVFLPYP